MSSSNNYQIVEVSKSNNVKYWKLFTEENKNTGPFYHYSFLEQLVGRGDYFFLENCSFIVLLEDKPVSITPLFLEEKNNLKTFSSVLGFNTFYGPLISNKISKKSRKKVRNLSFKHIDILAAKKNVLKSYITIDPFCYFKEDEYYNWLLEYRYIDFSIATSIIDLCAEEKELKKNFRTSYKALINKGMRIYDMSCMDFSNITYKNFIEYEKMHEKTAGRKTRRKKSFEIQYNNIQANIATIIGAKYKGNFVQFIYFNHLNGYVYYSSSAVDPDFGQSTTPISHALLWSAITYFKVMNNRYLEMGWLEYHKQLFNKNTKKEQDISFYKSGFGGNKIPLFRGIKYYDENFMKKELISSINEY